MNPTTRTLVITLFVLQTAACAGAPDEDDWLVARQRASSCQGDVDCPPCSAGDTDCAPACAPGDPSCVPSKVDCDKLAAELEALLIEVRSCNIASTQPTNPCSVLVPTVNACPVPANASSSELKTYLSLFDKYAMNCPLPAKPCADPSNLAMGCVQGPDVDSLLGVCDFIATPSVNDAD